MCPRAVETMDFTRLSKRCVVLGATLLQCIGTVLLVSSGDSSRCFCLQHHLSQLRNPVHMEPTVIKTQPVYLLAEQSGKIFEYNPAAETSYKLTTYIDLSSRVVTSPNLFEERGLLGFALHPDFVSNQKLYIYSIRNILDIDYVAVSEVTGTNVESERYLLLVEQPGTKRNGGQLLFGEDGYLYILIGDGGPADDDNNDAQNPDSLLGKILRVDVNKETVADYKIQHYVIPEDNPKKPGWRPEIFGLGVRNMWRCSEDRGDPDTGANKGRIICGELGENTDEIDVIKKGGNYGWPYREGMQCLNETMCGQIADEQLPMHVVNRSTTGIHALVGGSVYRGSAFPWLQGQYVYGDYVSGRVHSIEEVMENKWTENNFPACDSSYCDCSSRASSMNHLLSFAESPQGELFLLMTDEASPGKPKGGLFQLVKPSSVAVTCGAGQLQTTSLLALLLGVVVQWLLKKSS